MTKTTELLNIECALSLLEQVLARFGDGGGDQRQLTQRRLAIRKSLLSANDLLGIALQLLSTPENLSTKDLVALKRTMLQDIRLAARRTYEAGHLLIGVDLRTLTPPPAGDVD